MRYVFSSVLMACLSASPAHSEAVPVSAPMPEADTLVAPIEAMLAPELVEATYTFTNTRTNGTPITYKVDFKIRNTQKSHALFLEPEREKGREVLRLDDELWTFMPSVGRVVRIADRDSFAGGDFSNADILRVDWRAHYTTKVIKDLPKQWIIELLAKGGGAAYARMLLWVDKASGQPVQQHYFDTQGTLLKRCLYGDTKTFGGITRPARLVMENVITKQKSELAIIALAKVAALPESRFVVSNLGK